MVSGLVEALASEALLHIAFLTVAVAFLVRDVLWLRGLSIIAYSMFMAVAALTRPDAPWTLLAWYGGFIAINLAHGAWLICERQMCRLTADERSLLEMAFPALDQLTLKRLLRHGRWQSIERGVRLTKAGVHPERLYVVFEGRVDVYRHGKAVAEIGPGHFVGEMAFVTGGKASADTVVGAPLRVFSWDQSELLQACRRRPELRESVYSAIGPDLARKIAYTSDRVRSPEEQPDLVVAPSADAPRAGFETDRSDGSAPVTRLARA
jgi:CRP-like cAMP-binding protein